MARKRTLALRRKYHRKYFVELAHATRFIEKYNIQHSSVYHGITQKTIRHNGVKYHYTYERYCVRYWLGEYYEA